MNANYDFIPDVIHMPKNPEDYEKLATLLDKLLDIVGEDESHELMGLVDVVSDLIAVFDEEYYQL